MHHRSDICDKSREGVSVIMTFDVSKRNTSKEKTLGTLSSVMEGTSAELYIMQLAVPLLSATHSIITLHTITPNTYKATSKSPWRMLKKSARSTVSMEEAVPLVRTIPWFASAPVVSQASSARLPLNGVGITSIHATMGRHVYMRPTQTPTLIFPTVIVRRQLRPIRHTPVTCVNMRRLYFARRTNRRSYRNIRFAPTEGTANKL
jgi:hypothetical protein